MVGCGKWMGKRTICLVGVREIENYSNWRKNWKGCVLLSRPIENKSPRSKALVMNDGRTKCGTSSVVSGDRRWSWRIGFYWKQKMKISKDEK